MDIFKEFNKNVDKFTTILEGLASKNLISQKDTMLYNQIIYSIAAIQDYFNTGLNLDLGLSEPCLEAWKDFETNRAVLHAAYYTPLMRIRTVKRIMKMADGSDEKFIDILDWAIILGYKNIYNEILEIIEVKKEQQPQNNGTSFKESEFSDYQKFLKFFINHRLFNDLDFKHYYNRVLTWSESKGKTSKHWGFTTLQFIDRDINENKQTLLTKTTRLNETVNNQTYLNKLCEPFIKIPELKNITPIQYFRFCLTISADETAKKYLKEHAETLFKDNNEIKFLTIKN